MKVPRDTLKAWIIGTCLLQLTLALSLKVEQCKQPECEVAHPIAWIKTTVKCVQNDWIYEDGEKLSCVKPIFDGQDCNDPNGCHCYGDEMSITDPKSFDYCFHGDKCYSGLRNPQRGICGSVIITDGETCQNDHCLCTESTNELEQTHYISVYQGETCTVKHDDQNNAYALVELKNIEIGKVCSFRSGCLCGKSINEGVKCEYLQFCLKPKDSYQCFNKIITINEYCDPASTTDSCLCLRNSGYLSSNDIKVQRGNFCGIYQEKTFEIKSVIWFNKECDDDVCACGFQRIPRAQAKGIYVERGQYCTLKNLETVVKYKEKIGHNQVCLVDKDVLCACGEVTENKQGSEICSNYEICKINESKFTCQTILNGLYARSYFESKSDFDQIKCKNENCVCISKDYKSFAHCKQDEFCISFKKEKKAYCVDNQIEKGKLCSQNECACTNGLTEHNLKGVYLTMCKKEEFCSGTEFSADCSNYVVESNTLITQTGAVSCSFKKSKDEILYTFLENPIAGTHYCLNNGIFPFFTKDRIESGQECNPVDYEDYEEGKTYFDKCACVSKDGKTIIAIKQTYLCLIDIPEHANKDIYWNSGRWLKNYGECKSNFCPCDFSGQKDLSQPAVCAKGEYCINDNNVGRCRPIIDPSTNMAEWQSKYASDNAVVYRDSQTKKLDFLSCLPELKLKFANGKPYCEEPDDNNANVIPPGIMCFNKRKGCFCVVNNKEARCIAGGWCRANKKGEPECEDPEGSFFTIPPKASYMCSKDKYKKNDEDKTLYCDVGSNTNSVTDQIPSSSKEITEEQFSDHRSRNFFETKDSEKWKTRTIQLRKQVVRRSTRRLQDETQIPII